eukprot:251245_1
MTSKRSLVGLLTGVALGVDGARISRKNLAAPARKQVAGVPILNYDLARVQQGDEAEHWVVIAKAGVKDERLKELCESVKHCERLGHPSSGGVPFFEVFATMSELETVLASAPGELEFVEPDGEISLDPEEMDAEMTSASWGLGRVGADSAYATGAGAHIYVLDTGVRSSHNDFGRRAAPAIDLTSNTLVECEPEDSSCAGDVQGHGTHCAGTAGGSTYGVAVGAKIWAGKVLSDQGGGSWSWSYDALDWLATKANRPAISSMSLGGQGTQSAMQTAVDTAVSAGVTVVVAAGNSNSDACFFSPAFVPSAVTVGSTTITDERSGFSNFGSCVEIWAPGSNIVSALHTSDDGRQTLSGTSMACPHVSGGAALVLGQNPAATPSEVLEEMVSNAEKGAISGLKPEDVNVLLWVGDGSAPVPAPTPAPPPPLMCPDFAANRQPDRDGDCQCGNSRLCSRDGVSRNCPTSGAIGGYGGRFFP